MVPEPKHLAQLERRLGAALPLSNRVFVSGTGDCLTGAQMHWEDPNRPPRILWTPDLVNELSADEFDALCAHEHRHLAGWWGWQERFAFKDGAEPHRLGPWLVFAARRWLFEFQSDAFAASFTSLRVTRTMLKKVQRWEGANPAPPSKHHNSPHPPYWLRRAVLDVTRILVH
jgi:hypothetical protein